MPNVDKDLIRRVFLAFGTDKPIDIGYALGRDSQIVRDWRRGSSSPERHLRKIADVTGVSLSWLATGEGPMRPDGGRGSAHPIPKPNDDEPSPSGLGRPRADVKSPLIRRLLSVLPQGTTYAEFEEKAGIASGSMSRYASGEKNPSRKSIEKMANAANCDPKWLSEGEKIETQNNVNLESAGVVGGKYPIVGYAAADDMGARVHMSIDNREMVSVDRWLAVEVVGSSMEPIARSGQYLLIESAEPKSDDLVVIRYWDGDHERTLAKRWHRIGDTVVLTCVAEPAHHPPIEVEMSRVAEVWVVVGVVFRG
jgi:phage repressor protein C with HTH and peptisase S24 domain